MRLLSTTVALLAATLAACAPQIDPPVEPNAVENALSGEFGDIGVERNDEVLSDLSRWTDGSYSSYSLMLTAPQTIDGAIMGGLFISGIDLESLAPGTRIHVLNEPFDAGPVDDEAREFVAPPEDNISITDPRGQPVDAGDVYIDGIGCSGDDLDNGWDKDEPAEEIDIIIVEGPEGEPGALVNFSFASEANDLALDINLGDITSFNDVGPEPMLDEAF